MSQRSSALTVSSKRVVKALVVDHRRQVGEGRVGAARLAGLARVRHLAIVDQLFGVGLAGLAFAGLAFLGGGLDLLGAGGIGALAGRRRRPRPRPALAGLVAFVLVLAALAAELVAHFEGDEQVADGAGEAAPGPRSVSVRRGEVVAGALLDPVAPELDDLAARGRRGVAGQALAHHQRDGVLERRVGAVGDLLIVAAVIAVLEHGGEVVARRRPCGARRAPRRGPARRRRRRRGRSCPRARWARWTAGSWQARRSAIESPMPRVMATSRRGQLARRLGQARLVAGQQRPVGGEADLEVGLAGDGAHAADHRPLERFGRGFLGSGAGFGVGWSFELSMLYLLARVGLSSSRSEREIDAMADPENQTLHILRDIRAAIQAMDQRHVDLDSKFDESRRSALAHGQSPSSHQRRERPRSLCGCRRRGAA